MSSQSLGIAYLKNLVPQMDDRILRGLHLTLSGAIPDADDLLFLIEQKMGVSDPMDEDEDAPARELEPSWRIRVKSIVQSMIEPDEVSWMDGDESISDTQYATRACSEVENRFDR